MGKLNSKLSAESFDRLKHSTESTSSSNENATALPFDEQEIRNWCKGFDRGFPDARLTDIFDNEHLLAPFLTEIFYQEVEVSDCMQTLFRGNCLASKIMSHCFKTFGSKYLKNLLGPHIKPLTLTLEKRKSDDDSSKHNSKLMNETGSPTSKSGRIRSNSTDYYTKSKAQPNSAIISYEIDLTKLEQDGDINANQENLLRLTKQILDSILSSSANFPPQLNSMCICLRQALCKKYPDSESNLRAVGTVIFLRFINPAIVSPMEAGIVERQLHPRTMRGLMLVSKILQNIANNVGFSKEEHMLPFNDFVREQFEPMQRWVSEISTERNQENQSNN